MAAEPDEDTEQLQDTENPQSDSNRPQDDANVPGANGADTGLGPDTETEDNSASVLDQIRAQKRDNGATVTSGGSRDDESDSPGSGATSDSAEVGEATESEQRSGSETADQSAACDGDDQTVESQLAGLSEQQFETLVSELWESQGWSTTVMSVQATSAFDIVAMRERPTEERLGIWTLHGPQEPVDVEDVTACQSALAESEGAESATIVTTREVTTQAEQSAKEHGVAVVDTDELSQLLKFEGLTDTLDSLAVE